MFQRNLVPVSHNLIVDTETPISIFMKLEEMKPAYLLESVEGGERVGRYSFIGLDPMLTFQYANGKGVLMNTATDKKIGLTGKPMELIEEILAGFQLDQPEDYPPFFGGLVGYLGYEFIYNYEEIKRHNINKNELQIPECYLVLCSTVLIYDHVQQSLKVVVLIEDQKEEHQKAALIIAQIKKSLDKAVFNLGSTNEQKLKAQANFTKEKFMFSVNKAKEYIQAGDILQVVLSQRFQVPLVQSPFSVYRNLRNLNPSPYLFFLNFDEVKIIGSSPEMLVKVQGGQVETRPIAGTRPRGKNTWEDEKLALELLNDEKELAEHLMLVDLGRNDLSKVAKIGSVQVNQFMEIEKYSHVMHIVSAVKGKLAEGKHAGEALKSCFPAGTVSGSPKIRAMEIIDELEPTARGVYAGAILYFGLTGNLDSCIAIRTIVIKDNYAYVQAGAGIVKNSCPEAEYLETCNKAQALLMALGATYDEEERGDELSAARVQEVSG